MIVEVKGVACIANYLFLLIVLSFGLNLALMDVS